MFGNRIGQAVSPVVVLIFMGAASVYYLGVGVEKGAKKVAHGVEAAAHAIAKPFHHKKAK